MKAEESRALIRWYILGAVGGILMAAGDWLLGCVSLQATDTGMFNRAYYLSGAYGLWRPVAIVGLGAVGCFLYYFMVKALNTDIDARCQKAKTIQFLCGIFTVAVALAFHPVVWNILLAGIPDLAQALQVPVATWMAVMSQSSTNSSIVLWCLATAVYTHKHPQTA